MFNSIQDLSDTYAYNSVYKLVYIVVKGERTSKKKIELFASNLCI